jgi:hypothetical protein
MDNRGALLSIICYEPADDLHRVICGVVKELDLQSIAWVIEGSDSFYQPTDNVALIVNRELNRDPRKVAFPWGAVKALENVFVFLLTFAAVSAEEQEQHVAVGSVEKEPTKAQDIERA